jgi:hypothetical protein
MDGSSFGDKVKTDTRLEKRGPEEFLVTINAEGNFPENEYVFRKIAKKRQAKKVEPTQGK